MMNKLNYKKHKESAKINYKESTKARIIATLGQLFAFLAISILVAEKLTNSIIAGDAAPVMRGVLIFLAANGGWMTW